MNKKELAVVQAGISCGLAGNALVRYITVDGCSSYKNLKYWMTIVNKDTKELSKSVTALVKDMKGKEEKEN